MGAGRERAERAFKAMKELGVSSHKVKPVLKSLLGVYGNDWGHIEAENYRLLIDAIFEVPDETEEEQLKRKKETAAVATQELGSYMKKPRGQQQAVATQELGSYMKKPRGQQQAEPQISAPEGSPSEMCHGSSRKMPEVEGVSPRTTFKYKRAKPTSPQPSHVDRRAAVMSSPPHLNPGETRTLIPLNLTENAHSSSPVMRRRENRPVNERMENLICYKEPKVEPYTMREEATNGHTTALVIRSDDSCTGDALLPLAVICPTNSTAAKHQLHEDKRNKKKMIPVNDKSKNANATDTSYVQDPHFTSIDVASSTSGEVKLSFTCLPDRHDFFMPSVEAVCKMVEDKCLKSYKILNPKFSLMDVLKEICQCAQQLGSGFRKDQQENTVTLIPTHEKLKNSSMRDLLGGSQLPCLTPMNGLCSKQKVHRNHENCRNRKKYTGGAEPSNVHSRSLVLVQQPGHERGEIRTPHGIKDVTKGEERVRISLVNEVSSEKLPRSFHYIPHNIVYQNAYVNFSLARIGDEDCCSDCFGNCLAASLPCACARETGGEYAYNIDGLLKKEFLDDCVLMKRDPQKNRLFYCRDCPLERSKNEVKPESCKGHLVRRFVKECWSKCGCYKQCGNRVVQRGITCNLQVFFTAGGKGWGLRTLDELPRGAFVCEYVGEILTNMELYDRTILTTGNAKHTYPVLLDADWGSEGVLKDEEALCLDATFYGNVARFINHRCFDANVIEIPVEVETPDHHYYHLAFFTTRRIEAFEELTWDYGIDFDDHNHPIKAFHCRCGSELCRDSRCPTKARSCPFVLS